MLRLVVRVAEIEIAQINRQRQQILQHADRIPFVNEIAQHQKAAERAAFPKAKRDYTFLRSLGGDPLNEKARTENSRAEPTDDFPGINRQPGKVRGADKIKAVHNGGTLRQITRPEQLFVLWHKFLLANRWAPTSWKVVALPSKLRP